MLQAPFLFFSPLHFFTFNSATLLFFHPHNKLCKHSVLKPLMNLIGNYKMQNSSQLKKEFIKKWIQGLQVCCSSNKKMNLLERTKNIKLSADIALASAKNSTTIWSKAIISEAKKEEQNMTLVDNLSGRETNYQKFTCNKRNTSKKILKRSYCVRNKMKKMEPRRRHGANLASCIAKRLVKKRTQVLKRLVPGGEFMDEVSVIKEALDYILSLRVQVDVMKNLVNATSILN